MTDCTVPCFPRKTYREEPLHGNKDDVIRVAKKCMNQATGKRLISKQEAVVLLGEMPLTTCSETISQVSIANTRVIRKKGMDHATTNFVQEYGNRGNEYDEYSMYNYYIYIKNYARTKYQKRLIPYFVGISGRPSFPVKEDYAKFVLIVHRPWRDKFPESYNWLVEFDNFINSEDAPQEVLMEYNRVMQRYYSNKTFVEPVARDGIHSNNPVPPHIQELIDLTGISAVDADDYKTRLLKSMDRGKEFKWDKLPKVSFSQLTNNIICISFFSPVKKICANHHCFYGKNLCSTGASK